MRYLVIILAVFFGTLFITLFRPVLAKVECSTQYGGGQTCVSTGELLINKKVFNPATNQYVDNLTLNDHRFVSGDEVTFTIEVKNVGDAVINNITVTDTLPSFLVWSSGDPLVSTISTLSPGASATKTIRTKVIDNLISQTVCQLNRATIEAIIEPDIKITPPVHDPETDTAQVCIVVPPVKGAVVVPPKAPEVAPKSGPEYLALLLPLTGIGWFLRGVKRNG